MAATVFKETDNSNYVSIGSIGKTFVAHSEDGWIHGRVDLDAKSYPTEGRKFQTPEEALREASAKDGFIIDGRNSRNIGLRRISASKGVG